MEKRVTPERGQRIRRFREAAGLSQRELARQLNMNHSNVSFWERTGTAPRGSVLPKMAAILGVSVEDIIGGERGRKTSKTSLPGGRLGRVVERISRMPRRQQAKLLDVIEAYVEKNENSTA